MKIYKLKHLLENNSLLNELDDILDQFREKTNWTDWYMSGGCYTFAHALYIFTNKKSKIWAVGESKEVMAHTGIYLNGKYIDYNGVRSKSDILYDIYIDGSPIWYWVSEKDLRSEHNYDSNEVKKIIKTFNSF